MDLKTLKLWRFWIPAVVFAAFSLPILKYIPSISQLGAVDAPFFKGALYAFIFGLIYNMTPLRTWSNQPYHARVNQNISADLWKIAKPATPVDVRWDWPRARRVFYKIVDSDAHLTAKTQNVMSNGFLWTTAADIRAVSAVTAFILVILWISMGESHGVKYWFVSMCAIFFSSLPISEYLTRKHVALGKEQLDYISLYHKDDLRSKIDASLAAQ